VLAVAVAVLIQLAQKELQHTTARARLAEEFFPVALGLERSAIRVQVEVMVEGQMLRVEPAILMVVAVDGVLMVALAVAAQLLAVLAAKQSALMATA
jgi:hypothetical protein